MTESNHRSNLVGHILPTSGTMLGVCMTVLSIVKAFGIDAQFGKWIDDILAIDALLFLVSAFLSYLSLRGENKGIPYEERADRVFMLALVVMGFTVLILTYQIL